MQNHYVVVLRFSDIFPNDNIDIKQEIIKYKREDLVDTAIIVGLNFGNAFIPGSTFFSNHWDYVDNIRTRCDKFFQRTNCKKACFFTYKTSLELLRYIYSIDYKEFSGKSPDSEFEFVLFKVLLKINENLYDREINDTLPSSFVNYYMHYALNDLTKTNLERVFYAQCYYSKMLLDYLTTDKDAQQKLSSSFINIYTYRRYISTILYIMWCVEKHIKKQRKGVPYFVNNVFIDDKVLEELHLNIDENIAYNSDNKNDRNTNVDYRIFRSKPLVKDTENKYYVYNMQLLYEQLYNSIVFVLKEKWNKNNGNFFHYYDKHFIEEYLFQRTMLMMVNYSKRIKDYFPSSNYILSNDLQNKKEKSSDPDFYYRQGQKLFIFECKGMMINGMFKETTSIQDLFDELQTKLKNTTKDNNVVIKQLANHMLSIEDSINKNKTLWNNHLPKKAYCYPIFVLSDTKISQPGFMHLVNDWFYQEMKNHKFMNIKYKPIVIISIDILFLYMDLFKRIGIGHFIDLFLKANNAQFINGKWQFNQDADFNSYMLRYGFRRPARKFTEDYRKNILHI